MHDDGSLWDVISKTLACIWRRGTTALLYVTYANDALGPDKLNKRVAHGALGIALAISVNIAQVANVAGVVGWSPMGLAMRVD